MRTNSSQSVHPHLRRWLSLLLLACCTMCRKDQAPPLPPQIKGLPDIVKTLDSLPQFRLFSQALKTVHLDTVISRQDIYTVFALTDDAMKRAGLDQAGITAFPSDSLQKIMRYLVVIGAYPDSVLNRTIPNICAQSLRQDISFSKGQGYRAFRQSIYFSARGGSLYINGKMIGQPGPALQAANGWVYQIDQLIKAPERTLFEIISTRPELSLYRAALRIDDSTYAANGFPYPPMNPDSLFLSSRGADFQSINSLSPSYNNMSALPTLLAPTNDAFIGAGFHNADDIRNFNQASLNNLMSYNGYLAMDSVLKTHIVFNSLDFFYNCLFRNDITGNPAINNGVHNISFRSVMNGYYPNVVDTALLLRFLVTADKQISIRWNNGNSIPAARIIDSAGDIFATNGVLHEVDRLFYPLH